MTLFADRAESTPMNAARLVLTIDTAKDLKNLPNALRDVAAVELCLPTERWKAVASAIAKETWPKLHDLRIALVDFDPREEVGAPALTAKASAALWASLPSLTHLGLKGHALCRGLAHPTLESLDVDGYAFGAGALVPGGECPMLKRLRWSFSCDEHNVAVPPEALAPQWDQRLPGLTTLDLTGADIDGSVVDEGSLPASKLFSHLEVFGLPPGSADGWKKLLASAPKLRALLVTAPHLAGKDPRITVVEPPSQVGGDSDFDGDLEVNAVDDEALEKENLIKRAGPLKRLTVSYHDLGDAGATTLGRVAAAHPELETLNLNNPEIYGWRASALEAFRTAIGRHEGLKALHLRNNHLDGSGEALAGVIRQLPNLETLELSQTELTEADVAFVLPAIARLASLRELMLGDLDKSEASARVCRAFSSLTLEHLEVWSTPFSEAGWAHFFHDLGKRLPQLKSLRVPVFEAYAFSAATMRRLGDAFAGHAHLASISLDIQPSTGAWQALGALVASTPITHLSVEEAKKERVPEGEACDSDAIAALGEAKALESLRVDLDDEDLQKHLALASALATLPTMRDLSGWSLNEDQDRPTLDKIADTLASSTIRTYRRLAGGMTNALLMRGAIEELWIPAGYNLAARLEHRAKGLVATKSLRSLTLYGEGELKKNDALVLASILERNSSLREVQVRLQMKAAMAKELAKRCGKLTHLEVLTLGALASDKESAAIVGAVGKGSALKVVINARPLKD